MTHSCCAHAKQTCRIHGWVMSHMYRMSHVTRVYKSYYTCEWVMAHIWMDIDCVMSHAREAVNLHTWMSHVTKIYQSYYTYEWVMSHTWMRISWVLCTLSNNQHSNANESRHTCEWVMSHTWMDIGRVLRTLSNMSHTWLSHAALPNKSWRTYNWVVSHMEMCDVTHIKQ